MPERTVTVHRFDLLAREGDHAEFEIECSSGTYVRSLIADLGDAYCTELRPLAIGPFHRDAARRAVHGVAVPGGGVEGPHVRLTDADGLIAVAEPRPDGTLKPTVGFRGS